MTFCGLKSRWMTPAAWAAASPRPAARKTLEDRLPRSARPRRSHCSSVAPSTSSIAMKTRSLERADVVTATTFGCESGRCACASRRSRERAGRAPLSSPCDQLERDAAVELRVVRGVDLAHAAAPDRAQNLIAANACARLQLTDEGPPILAGQRDGVAAVLVRRHPGHELRARGAGGNVLLETRPRQLGQLAVKEQEHGVFVQAAVHRRANATPDSHGRIAGDAALLRAFREEMAVMSAAGSGKGDVSAADEISALYARGRAAHPQLVVSEDAFGRYLARAIESEQGPSFHGLPAGDVYLACACAQGARGAAAAFELAFGDAIRKAVSRVLTPQDREEAQQRVRQWLLVPAAAGEPPGIAKYLGTTSLKDWIRVVAVRSAISLGRSESVEHRLREKAAAEAVGVSPEQMLMKAEIRRELESIVAGALERLGDRDKLILRFFLVSGVTHRAIAKILGISQQAVSKQIARARDSLMEDIRSAVAARLDVSKDEVVSLMRFMASQLDVSVSRVLASR